MGYIGTFILGFIGGGCMGAILMALLIAGSDDR